MPDLHFLVCIKFALVYTASFYLLSLLSFLFPLVINVFFLFLVSPSCFTISLSSSLHFTLPFTETTIFPIKSPLISSFWLSLNTEALQWGTRKTWGPEVGVRPQAWGHTAIFWAFLFMLFSFSLTTFCVCVCVCACVPMNAWIFGSVTYGGVFVHMLVRICVNEWMCAAVCVCACVWMKAPGQAIRYWCSRLRVRRGKWMCACVLECARVCLCVCTGGHVVSSNGGWWKMASSDMISHLLIKMYCCRLIAVSLFEIHC